jgi:2-keto-3-deoxy-L-rhamnonate aldolase RhmA
MDPCAPVYGAAPTPADSDGTRLVIIMIGTPLGLANVRELCATPGVNGVYVARRTCAWPSGRRRAGAG